MALSEKNGSRLNATAIIVALITAGGTLIKTKMSKDQTDSDMRASYRVLAESVNELRFEVGRLQGRQDERDLVDVRDDGASSASAGPEDAGEIAIKMGEILIRAEKPAAAKTLPTDLDSALSAGR